MNDLISKSALLQKIDEEREYLKARGLFGAEHILVHNFRELVENAPAVEINTNDIEYKSYSRGLEDGKKLVRSIPDDISEVTDYSAYPVSESERPQGEWITRGQDIYCSVCNGESAYNEFGASKFSNFCPHCGAAMRKV